MLESLSQRIDSLTQLSEIDYNLEAMHNLLYVDIESESDQAVTWSTDYDFHVCYFLPL